MKKPQAFIISLAFSSIAFVGVLAGFKNKVVKAQIPEVTLPTIKGVSIPPSPNAPHIDEPSNDLLECSPAAPAVERLNVAPRVTSPGRVECPPGSLPTRDLNRLYRNLPSLPTSWQYPLKLASLPTSWQYPLKLAQTEYPGTGDAGFYIKSGIGLKGVYVGHQVKTTLNLPTPSATAGYTLYAPTAMPAGNSCLETVTVYFRSPGDSTTTRLVGVWDHCYKKNMGTHYTNGLYLY